MGTANPEVGRSALGSIISRWGERRLHWAPAIVWVPAVAITAAMLLPLVYLAIRTAGAGEEVLELLLRRRIFETLVRTVILVATVTAAAAFIAVPVAWLTVRTDLPLHRMWTVLTALPLVIPSYVAGFLVVMALGPRGVLQQLLEGPFGVDRLPEIYGFPGAMLTLTLLSYPYILLPVRAALMGQDPSLEEISRGLGHNAWKTFRSITLPLLRPAVASGALLVALYTLSDFGAVSLLRYETFTWAIYVQYESAFDRSLAAALSMVLVSLALGILVFETLTRGRVRYDRSTAGTVRPVTPVHLGSWRWPALALCLGIVLLSLALPTSLLIYWAVRGLLAGEAILPLWQTAWNSLYVSLMAAAATVLAALPIALLTVRYKSRLSDWIEHAAYVGFALPGVVVALALVFFGVNLVTPFYQTLGLLLMAYVILFLPTAIGAIKASLVQVSPSMEEAARNLGRKPFQVLTSISIPMMRPGVLAGAALVCLLTMKELPATLILAPIGFKTLATSVWSAASEAFFAQAAIPALLLLIISTLSMTFLTSSYGNRVR